MEVTRENVTYLNMSGWHNQANPTFDGVDFVNVVHSSREFIELMMERGIISRKESFGFALANWLPRDDYRDEYAKFWDVPTMLIACVAHWGPAGPRYAANAMRKIRAAARTGLDTQIIRLERPELFRDEVESQEPDGSFRWGDFPYGGAVHQDIGRWHLLGAVSAYTQEEDAFVATFLIGSIGLMMYHIDHNYVTT